MHKDRPHNKTGLLFVLMIILWVIPLLAFGTEIIAGPTLQLPGDDTMTIGWETDKSAGGKITYTDRDGNQTTIFSGDCTTHHVVRLNGLRPNQAYTYSIIVDNKTLYSSYFNTPSPKGPYRVALIGDTHVPAEGFSKLIPLIENTNPDYLIFLGDMVTDGSDKGQWLSFFQTGRDLFDHIPILTVLGNHEVDEEGNAVLYRYFFCRPENTPEGVNSFSVKISRDRFVFLDVETNKISFIKWFLETLPGLALSRDDGYLFVISHQGITSFKGNRSGSYPLRQFGLLMRLCGVTALFSGHDHHYVRGTTYWGLPFFISGGGGGAPYKINDKNIFSKAVGRMEASYMGNHFLLLEVTDKNCVVKAINVRGEIVDEVKLGPRD